MGRFLNPDQTLVDQYPEDPQSWNLYSYVRNSPLRFSDPSGRKCIKTDDGQEAEDDDPGPACTSDTSASDLEEVTAKKDSLGTAIGLNLFFALHNAASAAFAPIFDQTPRSLQHIPLNSGVIGSLAAVSVFAVEAIISPSPNTFRRTLQNNYWVFGKGLRNIRPYTGKELPMIKMRGVTELPGGDPAARSLFQQLTGRLPTGHFDTLRTTTGRVTYRSAQNSKSRLPKVEIGDSDNRFHEKITFK